MSAAYLSGFQLAFGLIAAIGAQNAFVIRQGIRREHVLAVCLFCACSDAVLIAAGVGGFAVLTKLVPALEPLLLWGGVAFLMWYGARSFLAAWRGGEAMDPGRVPAAPLGRTLGTLAVITWANPHVYLDTVVLLGTISAQYPGAEWMFGAGAITASFTFFFLLGYGARVLAPVFADPTAWRVLDALIGVVMWSIAASLALR